MMTPFIQMKEEHFKIDDKIYQIQEKKLQHHGTECAVTFTQEKQNGTLHAICISLDTRQASRFATLPPDIFPKIYGSFEQEDRSFLVMEDVAKNQHFKDFQFALPELCPNQSILEKISAKLSRWDFTYQGESDPPFWKKIFYPLIRFFQILFSRRILKSEFARLSNPQLRAISDFAANLTTFNAVFLNASIRFFYENGSPQFRFVHLGLMEIDNLELIGKQQRAFQKLLYIAGEVLDEQAMSDNNTGRRFA